MRKYILFVLLIASVIEGFSQTLTINVPNDHFQIDETNLLIVSHIEDIESFNNLSGYAEIILSLDQCNYSFDSIPNSLEYSSSYVVNGEFNQYTLYFTLLPLISIESENVIVNEPKVDAIFTYSDEEQIVTSIIGIELRGGYSLSYPKKTYDIEFWDDVSGEDTHNVQFGTLRNDDDWILDALYNEPLRIRSYIANKLWLDLHEPYYIADEPEAKSGADVKYVEMFLNGLYNGIYNLSEQIDRKQLELKSFNGEIRGELYQGVSWGAPTFTELPAFDNNSRNWSGYEFKYPKINEATNWQNLYDFTELVMNSTNLDFTDNIWNHFDYNNYLDYFIFLNLLRATDNTGKNIFVAKYKTNEPYFYIPWDLDGCLGTIWDGSNDNTTTGILANEFHNRVIDLNVNDYSTTIKEKWATLRGNLFDYNNLENRISESYYYLKENNVYARESLVYPNYSFNVEDLDYMLSWLHSRLSYMDVYFDISLQRDEFNEQKSKLLLYPNPAAGKIYLKGIEALKNQYYVIFNSEGRIIKEGYYNNYIPVSDIKNGTYLLSIDTHSYIFVIQ